MFTLFSFTRYWKKASVVDTVTKAAIFFVSPSFHLTSQCESDFRATFGENMSLPLFLSLFAQPKQLQVIEKKTNKKKKLCMINFS